MLEHADARRSGRTSRRACGNPAAGSRYGPASPPSAGPPPGGRELVARQRHAGDMHAVIARQRQRHAAPAAADVQHPHAPVQAAAWRRYVLLRLLRLFQRHVGVAEIGAAVLHVRDRGTGRRGRPTCRSDAPRCAASGLAGCAASSADRTAQAGIAAKPGRHAAAPFVARQQREEVEKLIVGDLQPPVGVGLAERHDRASGISLADGSPS